MALEVEFQKLVFGEDGLLTQFHEGKGIDSDVLELLYEQLEKHRLAWSGKDEVPRSVVSSLISLANGLYHDLPIYNDSDLYDELYPLVAKLAAVIEVLVRGDLDSTNEKLREAVQINLLIPLPTVFA